MSSSSPSNWARRSAASSSLTGSLSSSALAPSSSTMYSSALAPAAWPSTSGARPRPRLHRERRVGDQLEHLIGDVLEQPLELGPQVGRQLVADRLVVLERQRVELEHLEHLGPRAGDVAEHLERLPVPVVHVGVVG